MSELLDWRNIRKWKAKFVNCISPMNSCTRYQLILRKEDSTTGSGHDTLH